MSGRHPMSRSNRPHRSNRSKLDPDRAQAWSSRALLWLLLLPLATGCATAQMYDGESRPRGEVAVVEGHSGFDPLNPLSISFEQVDDVEVTGLFTRDVELLPGAHTLVVDAKFSKGFLTRREERTIKLDAEAGGAYEVFAWPASVAGLEVWVSDASGATVARAESILEPTAVAATVVFDGRSWRLVEAVKGTHPLRTQCTFALQHQDQYDWKELVQVNFREDDDPLEGLAEFRENSEQEVESLVPLYESETTFVYAWSRAEPELQRGVVSMRAGPSGVYVLRYTGKEHRMTDKVRDRWVSRFSTAVLRPISE